MAMAMASSDSDRDRDAHLFHRPSAPPDPEVVRNIEVLASFVAKNGPDFELLARRKTAGNPKFSFLKEEADSSSEAKAFYEWRKQTLLHRQFASDGSDDLQLKIFMMAQGSPSFPPRGIDHDNSYETVEKKGLDADRTVITQEKDNPNRKIDHVPHHRPRDKLKPPASRKHYESTTAEKMGRSEPLPNDSAKRSYQSDDLAKRSHQSVDSSKRSHQSDDSGKRSHQSFDSTKRSYQSDDSAKRSHQYVDSTKRSHQADDSAKRSHQFVDSTKRSRQSDDSAKRSHQSDISEKRSHQSVDSTKRSHYSDDSAKRPHQSVDSTKKSHQSDDSAKRPHQSYDSTKRSNHSDDPAKRPYQSYDSTKRSHQLDDLANRSHQPPHASRDDVKCSSLIGDVEAKELDLWSNQPKKVDLKRSSSTFGVEGKEPCLSKADLTRSSQPTKGDLCLSSISEFGARAPDSTQAGGIRSSQLLEDDLEHTSLTSGVQAKEVDLTRAGLVRSSQSTKDDLENTSLTAGVQAKEVDLTRAGLVRSSQSTKDDLENTSLTAGVQAKEVNLTRAGLVRSSQSTKDNVVLQSLEMVMKSATVPLADGSLTKSDPNCETKMSPLRDRGEGEMDQQVAEVTEKQAKEALGLKLLKAALADYVKEVLKPAWKEGNINKDAYKAIVKKVVDKVSGSLQGHQIPRSQENVDQYMAQSQSKIAKLVQGYVEKFKKI